MKLEQNSFNTYLNNNFLFEKFPQIAVAVSGGPDSMCLVLLLKKWIQSKKGSLIALIIDHQIRLNSNQEAKYVKKQLSFIKIRSKIIQVSKNKILKKKYE